MVDRNYKVVIVDDDEVSINMLQFELGKFPEFSIEGTAKNGASALRLIEKVCPDLLFLDVELPDMLGMELLGRLKAEYRDTMRVVFYTAYNKYLIEAVRNQAFDFLMKPIENKEFRSLIERFRSHNVVSASAGASGVEQVVGTGEKKFMIVTPTGDLCFLRPSEIGYFRYISERKIWEAIVNNGKVLPLKRSVTADHLCQFDPNFIQVHQSFIINMHYLMMVQDGRCILYPPFEKETDIILSKRYRKEIMEKFYLL